MHPRIEVGKVSWRCPQFACIQRGSTVLCVYAPIQIALDLHILADRFSLSRLKTGLETHLSTIVTTSNVVLFYLHAQASSAPQLEQCCESFMDEHASEVIASHELRKVPRGTFKMLVARDSFAVEEIEIFEAVKKWIEEHELKREEAEDLLECVRLSEIPVELLKEKVLPTGLFSRAAVLEAMGERGDGLATRGKIGECVWR